MKIKFTLVAMFLFSTYLAIGQIPNSGFESWETVGTHINPAFWGTMNNSTAQYGIYTATKGTPGSPGASYLKLTTKTINGVKVNGIAVSGVLDSITKLPISGFPFSDRPQSFKGKWQHMIYGTSQGSVNVKLTRWDSISNQRVTVAIANKVLSGMAMAWEDFTINFSYQKNYNPDSCIITLKASGSSPTNNDYLWVDNLSFFGLVVGLDNPIINEDELCVFPNPGSECINIFLELEKPESVKMQIIDISGRILIENHFDNVSHLNERISSDTYSSGIYFVKVFKESGDLLKKIIIN